MSVRPLNLAAAFDRHLTAEPDVPALIRGDQTWTRAAIADLASRAATTLLDLGAQPGGTVVAQYNTSAEDLAIALATARLGCTFIPAPVRMGLYELDYILQLARPVLLALHDNEGAKQISVPGGVHVSRSADVVAGPADDIPYATEPADHIPVIGFTSGSTGRPKGVMHHWSSLGWVVDLLADIVSLRPGEPICVTGAGAGVPGFTFYSYLGLTRGAVIVCAERWDPGRVLELMARERCVWSTMVPTMLHMLIEAKDARSGAIDLSSMRGISMGGAPMSEDLIVRAREALGVEVLRVYAMAECMMNSHMRLTDPTPDRNVMDGRPGPGAELGVFGPDGTRLPVGEVGEVGLKGPSLFHGYLGDPDGKASQLTPDGFFLSGDVGAVTDGGYIKIVGRKKDMIIRGGFNIDPAEVEELLLRHPSVKQVALVGYPDARFGERACAFILTCAQADLALDDVKRFLLDLGLSKEKLPERVICCDALPLSPDGKILKGELRRQLAQS